MLSSTRTKIEATHLQRQAVVYVRQSTTKQVAENLESQRRQYAMAELAQELGFKQVEVIDEDLGRSGSGSVERPGFQRLFETVASGQVGAIFCLEASRLARNGQDWHALLEVCAFVGSVIVSPDGVADPSDGNDRLLLGLKGTLSEYELTLFRQRALEARRAKTARGEFKLLLPVGYRWEQGEVVLEPDRRVQEAINQVFSKFSELGSIRQTHKWFCHEEIQLPVIQYRKGQRPSTTWRSAAYGTVQRIVKNAVYAGAYVAGKTRYKTELVNGRTRKRRTGHLPRDQWRVLIRDHHPAYISWETYEQNERILVANNYRMAEISKTRGRGGRALLAGLLRCRRCGRKLHIAYSGHGGSVVRYHCANGKAGYGLGRCLSFGGQALDDHVSDLMLQAVSPRAVGAAQRAVQELRDRLGERQRLIENELEQAHYEARLAQRRYEAVDPDNRLVADQLESTWNDTLQRVSALQRRVDDSRLKTVAQQRHQTQRLWELANDFTEVWESSDSDMQLKQRIVHCLIEEIIVDVDDEANMVVAVVHWRGGRHTETRLAKRRPGHSYRATPESTVEILTRMGGRWTDDEAAALLNKLGLRTGTGKAWNRSRVRSVRVRNDLPAHDADHAAQFLNMKQAAKLLSVSTGTIRKLISKKWIIAEHVCSGARWEIPRAALQKQQVVDHAAAIRAGYRPRIEPGGLENLTIPGLWLGDST